MCYLQSEERESFSTLEYLDFWLRSIFAHASTTNKKDPEHKMFSPPVLIVGTHKDCLQTESESIEKVVSDENTNLEIVKFFLNQVMPCDRQVQNGRVSVHFESFNKQPLRNLVAIFIVKWPC